MPLTKVSAGVIAANAVQESVGSQSITGDKLGLTAINANNIVNASITGAKIALGTITGDDIATGQITGNLLTANCVSGNNIVSSPTITGNVTINGSLGIGGATPASSGFGITFPGTQVASTDANTLDDYEEGTWTPTLTYTGGNGNLSYAVNDGTYIKIGKMVMFTCHLQFGETTASGYIATINGLPFTSTARAGGGFNIDNMTGLTGGAQWQMQSGTTAFDPTVSGTGVATVISSTNTGAATNVIILSGVYRA